MRKLTAILAAVTLMALSPSVVEAKHGFYVQSYDTTFDHATSIITFTIKLSE